eukprot:gene18055-10357_t
MLLFEFRSTIILCFVGIVSGFTDSEPSGPARCSEGFFDSSCQDVSRSCAMYKAGGFCSLGHMKKMCKSTCGECDVDEAPACQKCSECKGWSSIPVVPCGYKNGDVGCAVCDSNQHLGSWPCDLLRMPLVHKCKLERVYCMGYGKEFLWPVLTQPVDALDDACRTHDIDLSDHDPQQVCLTDNALVNAAYKYLFQSATAGFVMAGIRAKMVSQLCWETLWIDGGGKKAGDGERAGDDDDGNTCQGGVVEIISYPGGSITACVCMGADVCTGSMCIEDAAKDRTLFDIEMCRDSAYDASVASASQSALKGQLFDSIVFRCLGGSPTVANGRPVYSAGTLLLQPEDGGGYVIRSVASADGYGDGDGGGHVFATTATVNIAKLVETRNGDGGGYNYDDLVDDVVVPDEDSTAVIYKVDDGNDLSQAPGCVYMPITIRVEVLKRGPEADMRLRLSDGQYGSNSGGALGVFGAATARDAQQPWWALASVSPLNVDANNNNTTGAGAGSKPDGSGSRRSSTWIVLFLVAVTVLLLVLYAYVKRNNASVTSDTQPNNGTEMLQGIERTGVGIGARKIAYSSRADVVERCLHCNAKQKWCTCNNPSSQTSKGVAAAQLPQHVRTASSSSQGVIAEATSESSLSGVAAALGMAYLGVRHLLQQDSDLRPCRLAARTPEYAMETPLDHIRATTRVSAVGSGLTPGIYWRGQGFTNLTLVAVTSAK